MRLRWFSSHPWRVLVPIVLLTLTTVGSALAGRNANGALIVHTDDAVTHTGTADYCATSFLPASCEAAITRTDKDEATPAVIWLLAAFPDTSSPAVTTIQFGIEHNLPANEGYFERYEKCGGLELPDTGWPETGFGNLLSFGSAAETERLFPFYWFAAYGFEGAFLGTRTYPSTDEANFVDDASPPVEDQVYRFGIGRWGAAGSNECPAPQGEGDGNTNHHFAEPPTSDIAAEGEVYLYGHYIPPPYAISVTDSSIMLNDIQIYPHLHASSQPQTEIPQHIQDKFALSRTARSLAEHLQNQHEDLRTITDGMANIYRESLLVEGVSDVRPGAFKVHWRDEVTPEIVQVRAEPPELVDFAMKLQLHEQTIARLLGKGCLLIMSSGGDLYVPRSPASRVEAVRAEIRTAMSTSDEDFRQGGWSGHYLSSAVAQQFHNPLQLTDGEGDSK